MKKSLGASTVLTPVPVWVIGSYDENGKANFMTASWAGISSSKPPCLNVSIRPERLSYKNIMDSREFTVNVASSKFVSEVDYFGIVSGNKNPEKVEKTGLKIEKAELVNAPFIADFDLVAECKLIQTVDLGAHVVFFGEIMDVKASEGILVEGKVSVEAFKPFVYATGVSKYYALGQDIAPAFRVGSEKYGM